jgi:hypothetical protein
MDADPGVPPGSGGGAGTGGSIGDGDGDVSCQPGIPATSQVPRMKNRVYAAAVKEMLGVDVPAESLLDDSDGPMDPYMWTAYQQTADGIASEVIGGANKAKFIACDPGADPSCYDTTIRAFGRKAFRRPMTDEEVGRFMGLTQIMPAGSADDVAEALLYAFLVSPSFIMMPELGAEMEGSAFKLSSHEVATRLAVTLWGSLPDDELNAAADANMLTETAQIVAQAQRMVQDRVKTGPQIAAAHGSWLGMDTDGGHWWKPDHDPAKYAGWDPASKESMKQELDMFFEEVAYSGGGFKDLFTSTAGFVNAQTAPLYGLPAASYGADLQPETLTGRPGFLTRAGFLSSFSNYDATSPILRGAFITVNLIGVDPGAPDPEAAKTPIPPGTYVSRREQIDALTSPPTCAKCHGQFVNPPGYLLEGFDAVGNVQTVDPLGGPIDTNASVTLVDGMPAIPMSSPVELMEAIGTNPKSQAIYAKRIVSFATGRLPNPQDACLADAINGNLTAVDGYSILNLFADLTQADSFRLRSVGN